MSMSDLEQAIQLIDDKVAIADFEGPRPEELVKLAEVALTLEFPPTYREFVRRLGAGDIAGAEFYGVIKGDFENSSVPDAIWLTLDERKTCKLPEPFIIVGDTGDGNYYVIDLSDRNPAGEGPVVEWSPGNRTSRVVAEDFGAFLLQRLRLALH